MTTKGNFAFEAMIFQYIDEFKFLFFPDQWSSAFLDYSKNEVLALLLIYRKKSANMTEVAEYINAPLNTATGVVARLEKKLMLERTRDKIDRRVVNLVLTDKAEEFIIEQKSIIEFYFKEVYKSLTEEEKAAGLSILNKVVAVLKRDTTAKLKKDEATKKIKRIIIE